MCIILPVDHLPCTHTVAVWQHCINAPRSKAYGLEPCSKIRQHARPILTRKLCINCGGPRFFARRGGVAERGKGSAELQMKPRDYEGRPSFDEDSGYHSDAIIEEDEEDNEFSLSPKAVWVGSKIWRRKQQPTKETDRRSLDSSSSNETIRSSTRRRRPSWRPSLTKEPSEQALHFARNKFANEPIAISSDLDLATMTSRPQLPNLDTTVPQRPRMHHRKNSTLLHPSSPPASEPITPPRTPSPPAVSRRAAFAFPISSKLKPHRPPPIRMEPTLPRTMSPEPVVVKEIDIPAPKRPGPPRRKSSTLLHPSSPPVSPPLSPTQLPSSAGSHSNPDIPTLRLPTPPSSSESSTNNSPSQTSLSSQSSFSQVSLLPTPIFVFPPTLKPKSIQPVGERERRPSILHSSLSDDEGDNGVKDFVFAQRARIARAKGIVVGRDVEGN